MLPPIITTIPGIERAVARAVTEASDDLGTKLQAQVQYCVDMDKPKIKARVSLTVTLTAVGGAAWEIHATVKAAGAKSEHTASEVVNANGIVARVADNDGEKE